MSIPRYCQLRYIHVSIFCNHRSFGHTQFSWRSILWPCRWLSLFIDHFTSHNWSLCDNLKNLTIVRNVWIYLTWLVCRPVINQFSGNRCKRSWVIFPVHWNLGSWAASVTYMIRHLIKIHYKQVRKTFLTCLPCWVRHYQTKPLKTRMPSVCQNLIHSRTKPEQLTMQWEKRTGTWWDKYFFS